MSVKTGKRPSFQFYPSDWLRDTALRMCSLEARGLWIDMLAYMHEGCPYGHLKVGTKDILPGVLARMVGTDEQTAERLIAELEESGVLSRTDNGTIYSRRMVRDEQIRCERAEGGKESQKILTSHAEKPMVSNPEDMLPPTIQLSFGLSFHPILG